MAGMIAPTTKVIGCVDDDVEYAAQTLLRNYYGQQGGLIDDVFLQHGQYGGWLGEKTLKRFFRGLPVAVQDSLKMIRDVGMSGAREFAGDLSRGEDWRKAGLKRLGETGGTIASKVLSRIMTGRGGRRRNIRHRGAATRGSSSATTGRVGRRRKRRKTAATRKRRAPARRRRKTAKKTTKRRRRRTTKQTGLG